MFTYPKTSYVLYFYQQTFTKINKSQLKTVGARRHLMSSDEYSSLSNLVSATCESSESAFPTDFYLF